MADAANILVDFLIIAVVGSLNEGMEVKNRLEALFCSLPVSRRSVVFVSYLNTLVFSLIGILYTVIAGVLINLLFPASWFLNHSVISFGESLFVVFLMGMNAVVHNPLHFRFGSMAEKKLLYFFMITATVIASFWVLPYLMILLSGTPMDQEFVSQYGPLAPLVMVGRVFSNRWMLTGCIGVLVLMIAGSVLVSVRSYNRRDVD